MPQRSSRTGGKAVIWQKPTPKPTKPKTTTGLGAPYTATRWGDTIGSVNSTASPYVPPAGKRNQPTSSIPTFVNPDNARGVMTTTGGGGGGVSAATSQVPKQYVSPDGSGAVRSSNGVGFNSAGDTNASIAGYGFTPEGYNQIYQDPSILASALLEQLGITNPGLAQSLGDYFNAAISSNFILNNGDDANLSDANTLGYANDYMKALVTPGGSVPQFDELLNAILGAAGDDNSLLGAYMGSSPNSTLGTDKQIEYIAGLISNSLAGMNPYGQRAYSQYLDDQETQYRSGLARSQPGASSYGDWLAANWTVNR